MSGAGTPDFFYREARRVGYVARSAFKLLQMQKQFKLIKPGASVLDLGCAPGAWLQVACQSLGPFSNGGEVVGVDLKGAVVIYDRTVIHPVESGPLFLHDEQKVKVPSIHCDSRVRTVCADVMNLVKDQAQALSHQGKGFSVVLSDMCPAISGITTKDAALSIELGTQALSLALGHGVLPALDDRGEELTASTSTSVKNDGVLQRGGNLVIKLLESEDAKELGKISKTHFRKVSWLRPKATRSSSKEIYLICQGLR